MNDDLPDLTDLPDALPPLPDVAPMDDLAPLPESPAPAYDLPEYKAAPGVTVSAFDPPGPTEYTTASIFAAIEGAASAPLVDDVFELPTHTLETAALPESQLRPDEPDEAPDLPGGDLDHRLPPPAGATATAAPTGALQAPGRHAQADAFGSGWDGPGPAAEWDYGAMTPDAASDAPPAMDTRPAPAARESGDLLTADAAMPAADLGEKLDEIAGHLATLVARGTAQAGGGPFRHAPIQIGGSTFDVPFGR